MDSVGVDLEGAVDFGHVAAGEGCLFDGELEFYALELQEHFDLAGACDGEVGWEYFSFEGQASV